MVCPQTYVVRSQPSRLGRERVGGLLAPLCVSVCLGHGGEVFIKPPGVLHFPLPLDPASMLTAVLLLDPD